MRRHLSNAAYGVLDYISYPLGMLLVAPVVLHRLGAAEYGLWMIATAVISAGSIIASGCCDACIQRVASFRGNGNFILMPQTVRSMLAINIALGSVLATAVWIAAPYAAVHIVASSHTPLQECVISLRIASVCIIARAIEGVGVGVRRSFENYQGAVYISTAIRLLILASAATLALFRQTIVSILIATAIALLLGAWLQFLQPRKLFGNAVLLPDFQPAETRALLGQGVFAWLQAVGGVVFSQFDRILLGVSLGAIAVAPYSLCVQFAHPLFGLSTYGLNFIFPHISSRAGTISNSGMKRMLLKAFICNLLLVAIGSGILLFVGDHLIRIWAGPAVALIAKPILPPIVLGSALMGLSVTGTYAMQALGHFRTVAYLSLAGKASMLLLMVDLLHRSGLPGLALSRLCYGAIALLVYPPLVRLLNKGSEKKKQVSLPAISLEAQEGSTL
jgi:O-antigen/teichoic acid export membrane protein